MANELSTENWLSLKDAAAHLAVHPATLRRWADKGVLPYMLTPGGHRRFSEADVERFLQEQRRAQPTLPMAQVWAEQALTRTRQGLAAQYNQPWMETMDDAHREMHRQLGRRLMGLTLQYISSEEANGDLLQEARSIGQEYGRINRAIGMSLSDALAASMYFRDELIEVALQLPDTVRVRTHDNLRLMRRINQLLNAVHLAIAEVFDTGFIAGDSES
ncbi:MAG: helix-turn-helix domain-containing protein [Ardenticatenaceae bacterium]|nr:helix-turn-helix domain-containing protein [Anaerolineales bacterium]MCB8921009.1 helix-turn-helix domain-containing protein [Ardenticatenaceae bacterium]MCB9004196.1 helix-turn-helix domain-containing protein [Ardenticatenaceae bacterium]